MKHWIAFLAQHAEIDRGRRILTDIFSYPTYSTYTETKKVHKNIPTKVDSHLPNKNKHYIKTPCWWRQQDGGSIDKVSWRWRERRRSASAVIIAIDSGRDRYSLREAYDSIFVIKYFIDVVSRHSLFYKVFLQKSW